MKFLRTWFPPVVWMIIIFVLSSRESTQISDTQLINFLFFKALHVIEYAILFVLYLRALKYTLPISIGVNFLATAFLLTLLYAATDEMHQLFVPTREGRLRDVIIDSIGALLSWILIAGILPRAPKKLREWAKNWDIT